MCGFAGVLGPAAPGRRELAERMGATLEHRGPDDRGVWTDDAAGIALAHRRLAIIDLSEQGHQPMLSSCGRWVVVYNGEIYGFAPLREELETGGYPFRGHSDTEVLLAAVARWGIEEAVRRINGMFAFALWDTRQRALFLARDRAGKKPLYYGWVGGDFVFGSELKALRAHPRFDNEVDRDALTAFLRFTYVPAPLSIYRDVFKLRPATILRVDPEDVGRGAPAFDHDGKSTAYWSAIAAAERGTREPFEGSDAEAEAELDRTLRDAVARRMIADVPLGSFLSGGIDSSTIVSLMQAGSSRPVRTFSVGFHHEHDEAGHAGAVARHLGTDHTEVYVTEQDALATVERMPAVYDEPFADSSQIPTLIISGIAREHVTVALSGDGGDELFFGYRRYFRGRRIWSASRHVPLALRRLLARGVRRVAAAQPAEARAHRLAADIEAPSSDAMFLNRVSRWKDPAALVIGGSDPPSVFGAVPDFAVVPEPDRRMMLVDVLSYLTDDILVKVDRASMAVSLEVRAPLLDYRVIELAFRMPMALKFRGGTSKWILRRVLARYVPPSLTDRPKVGFGSPIAGWLKGALREWGEALLSEERLRREGFFHPGPIRAMWQENLDGRRKWHNHLWPVLMFQAWLEQAHAPGSTCE